MYSFKYCLNLILDRLFYNYFSPIMKEFDSFIGTGIEK